jgi:xanthine dehydrogenase accessory factor
VTSQHPDGAGVFPVLGELLARGETVIMVTIVGRRGSTPRKIGTKMLVRSTGAIVGTVGGGTAEAEICRQAATVLDSGRPQLLTLDFTGTLQRPGLGICGGSVDVFIEPWSKCPHQARLHPTSGAQALELVRAVVSAREAGRSTTLVTVVEASGPWTLFGDRRPVTNGTAPDELTTKVALAAAGPDPGPTAGTWVRTLTATDGAAQARVLVEALRPPEALFIMGGGHIAQPLAAIAAICGLAVTVVDDRQDFATAARFPAARAIAADGVTFLAERRPGAETHVVFVSRGPTQDIAALRALLNAAAGGYVGLIGSERRVWSVLATLRAEGMPAEQLARVHGPVGLALGGTAPAEIALEIMAELLKWRRQSTGQERSARLRRRLLRPEAPASG